MASATTLCDGSTRLETADIVLRVRKKPRGVLLGLRLKAHVVGQGGSAQPEEAEMTLCLWNIYQHRIKKHSSMRTRRGDEICPGFCAHSRTWSCLDLFVRADVPSSF